MTKTILAAIPICAGLVFAQTPASTSSTDQNSTGSMSQSGSLNQSDSTKSASGRAMTGILVASGCSSSSMSGAWQRSGNANQSYNSEKMNSGTSGDMNRPTNDSSNSGNLQSSNRSNTNSTTSDAYDVNRTTNATAGGDLNRNTGTGTGSGSMGRTDNRSGSTTTGSSRSDMARNTAGTNSEMNSGTQPGDMNRNTVGDRSVNTPQTGMADRERGGDTSATNSGDNYWEHGGPNTGGWDSSCFISPTTTSYVFLTRDGRQLRLDDASNSMIQQRLQSTNRVSQKNKIFRVRVNGDSTGDTLHITDIQM